MIQLSQIRKERVRMEIDGEIVEDDFLFGAISNSTSVGGVLTIDPRLRPRPVLLQCQGRPV